jgi:hypothetical protein
MQHLRPALRVCAPVAAPFLALLALAGCSGAGLDLTGSTSAPVVAAPAAPPVNMSGRWLFSSPGRGQCHMTFGSAAPTAIEGTIAPEGGCPGKFYMSRKWAYEQGAIMMRDHNGQPLAQLSSEGPGYQGKATSGEAVTLLR